MGRPGISCQVEGRFSHLIGDMNTSTIPVSPVDDAALIARSLAGSREAFGLIVTRYESLVCALTFSATGSVSRSEDLAQETFVTAWKQLAGLREPAKFRAWLCGIARNTINADRRRQGREPAHQAETLDGASELVAPEPLPSAQAITAEEMGLLWREVGRLPEIYRESLVLYYREQQSVARVAAALDLGEEAVMQRLSRGRKLLHEQMLTFVEDGLGRSGPRKEFMLGVQAALPVLAVAGQGAGLASAKGMALKGGGGLWAFALPLVGMLAALGLSRQHIRQAHNARERRFAKWWNIALWTSIGALLLALRGVAALAEHRQWVPGSVIKASVGVWFCYLMILVTLLVLFYRRLETGFREQAAAGEATPVSKNLRAELIATYVASTAWMVGLAWLMGDGVAALIIVVLTTALAGWNFREARRRSGWAVYQLNFSCHAALCTGLLLAANLRLDRWVAPLYRMPVDEMHVALPMGTIHLLSAALVIWAGVLFMLTKRRA